MDIEIFNIYKDFTNSYSSFILDIPKICFQTGCVTFIMGPNGSGKTVFLKILSGEFQNDKKNFKILINNKQVRLRGFGKILRQNAIENLALELTVAENFIIHSRSNTFIRNLLPSFFLKDYLNQRLESSKYFIQKANQSVKELSGGQQQTLAFFVTASSKSKMLLLDEFLASTDLETSSILLNESKKYAEENNASVTIVSHDIDIALEYANKIILFSNGKLIEELNKGSNNWNKEILEELLRKNHK